MALPCTLGSELILYFTAGGEKKKKLSSKPFSLGEKPAWSERSAQKCHLIQQLAHASRGSCGVHCPCPRAAGGEPARPLLLAAPFPQQLHRPLLPPHLPLPFSPPALQSSGPGARGRPVAAQRCSGIGDRGSGMAAPAGASSRPPARSSRGEGRSHPVSCKYLSLFPLES